jgi:hypothetical protein
MAIRFPFQPVAASPGSELYRHWGASGYSRPTFDVFVIGPGGRYVCVRQAHLDTGADHVVFAPAVATSLGLTLPFAHQVGISSAGGQASFSMPPDGLLSLFITDYREYAFLRMPPVGFWSGSMTRNVLGITGFVQYFSLRTLNDGMSLPEVELEAIPNFPGLHGRFTVQPLASLFQRLRP